MGTWWGQPLQDRRADECTKVWTVPGTQWEAAPSPALPGKKGWLPRGLRVYWEPWKTEIGVITRFPLTPGGILIALDTQALNSPDTLGGSFPLIPVSEEK